MLNRRRVARLLDRLSLFLFGGYVECWQPLTQQALDDLIDTTEAKAQAQNA